MHVDKWIDVDVTMEMYARPYTRSDARSKWLVQKREDALDAPVVSKLLY